MLKILKSKNTYSVHELAQIYPGFHYTFELFKCLTYNAENNEFIAHKSLPTFTECMNSMAEIYSIAPANFKDLLKNMIAELRIHLYGFCENIETAKHIKALEILNNVLTLLDSINFPDISSDLVIEPVRLKSEGPEALLNNLVYAVKLIQKYYEGLLPVDSQLLKQLENVCEELFTIDL